MEMEQSAALTTRRDTDQSESPVVMSLTISNLKKFEELTKHKKKQVAQ